MTQTDDLVAAFTIDGAPLLGRIVRLGPGALDPILRRHAYPTPVALLLGEALVFAALFGSLLKGEGRLVVQAQGDGPVPLLVAEYRSSGALRGYARLAPGAAEPLGAISRRVPPRDLIGEGALLITLDQGEDFAPYQSVVALEGETLSACVEAFFAESDQTPTRLKLAVGAVFTQDDPPLWRAGGVLIQKIAADDARGETEEGWNRADIFLATLSDEELIDPALPADRVLFRLFHEDGVRMAEPAALEDKCACDESRLAAVLKSLTAEEIESLKDEDGLLDASCQFCSRKYRIDPASL